jgi:hypothetical protein
MRTRDRVLALLLALNVVFYAGAACALARHTPDRVVIPAVPFLNRQVLLMDALADDVEVCTFTHAYTGNAIRTCVTMKELRAFINGHALADDAGGH